MPLVTQDLPVLLRADGQIQLTQELSRDTRWGRFVVWAGFVSDLASVPFVLRGLIANAGRRVNLAAIFHDMLCNDLNKRYREGRTRDERDPDGPMAGPRSTDQAFYEFLRDLGTPPLLARMYWTGVRWGALANPARRDSSWWRDAPLVLLMSILTGWFVVPLALLTLLGVGLYQVAEHVIYLVNRLIHL